MSKLLIFNCSLRFTAKIYQLLSDYSWNSLTPSRWDRRKYELSEVRVKHQLFMTVFLALKSDGQRLGYLVHTSYVVDKLYIAESVPFGEGLSMNYTLNMKDLFIAKPIAETQQTFFYYHSVSTHHIHVYRSDINRVI